MVGLGALLQRGGWGRWGGIKRLGGDKEALLVGGGYNGIVSGSMEGDCGYGVKSMFLLLLASFV